MNMKRKGILYGVGVGPGDPELITLKALRIIQESEIIAFPGKSEKESAAFKIASAAAPGIKEKTLVPLDFAMSMDRKAQRKKHSENAGKLEAFLAQGKDVAFLTLGDVSIYSTFSYLQEIAGKDGFETKMISGVPSFCAAAAKINIPLASWNETLHIIPAREKTDERALLDGSGNFVLMKSGSEMQKIKERLSEAGFDAKMIENCGMENEKIYQSLDEIPLSAGYFSLIIARRKKDSNGEDRSE